MRMWELRRNGVASEPISEADLEDMLAAGTVEGAMPVRPVGKEAWKPAVRHAPFASAASRAPRRDSATLMSASGGGSPQRPAKDPARWDQQTQLNMPAQPFVGGPPPPLPAPATESASPPTRGSARPAPLSYAPPPQAPTTTRAGSAPAPGFTAGLFDFAFDTFLTTRVVKTLYLLFVVAVCLGTAAGVVSGIAVLAGAGGRSGAALAIGVVQTAVTPIVGLFILTCGRIMFESVVVFFRVAEHLAEINRKMPG